MSRLIPIRGRGPSPLGIALLCCLAAFPEVSAAEPDEQVQEARLAALRRQHYDENQRLIAQAFQRLQQAGPSGPVLTAQLGHSRAVNSLSMSADGRLLLTGSDDRTARLWSLAGGRELRRFLGQQSNVMVAALSPDGKLVATGGSDDHLVRVWDALTGSQRLALAGHGDAIGALAFSPDGKTLASVSWDDSLRVWELASGSPLHKFEKAVRGLSAAFTPDGKRLLTLDDADKPILMEVTTGTVLKRLELQESAPAFAFAADGKLAAIGGRVCDKEGSCRAQARTWDLESGQLHSLPSAGDGLIRALALSPDKRQLAIGTGVGVFGKCEGSCGVQVLELPGGRELWRQGQALFTEDVKELAFTPDGRSLLAAGNDGLVRALEAATGRLVATLGGDVLPVSAVAVSPDRRWLAVGNGNTIDLNRSAQTLHVILWELTTGREARRLELFGNAVSNLWFSADSRLLAAGSRGDPESCPKCTARLWEVATGREVQSFATDPRRGGFALAADGRKGAGSAAGADSYAIGIWEAQSGKLLQRVEGGEQWAFAFAPGGATLASVGGAGDVTLRDARSGRELRALSSAHADMRPCLAFSPDGRLVAAGATSLFSSAVWDVRSGKVLSLLDGHSRDVTDIRVSGGRGAGGPQVATASLDATALLWGARSGKLQHVLAGHLGGVTAVAFSPDDRVVVTGSLDGTARLWDSAAGQPLAQLISLRGGGWSVLSADGHVDASDPGGYHFVDGDQVVPAEQAQVIIESAREPGLLHRVFTLSSKPRK